MSRFAEALQDAALGSAGRATTAGTQALQFALQALPVVDARTVVDADVEAPAVADEQHLPGMLLA